MRSNVGQGEQLASSGVNITLRSDGTPHSARMVHCTPLGWYTAPRSEGTPHPARRVHRTPLGGYTALRSEGTSHSERDGQLCLMPVINNFRPGKKPLAFSV